MVNILLLASNSKESNRLEKYLSAIFTFIKSTLGPKLPLKFIKGEAKILDSFTTANHPASTSASVSVNLIFINPNYCFEVEKELSFASSSLVINPTNTALFLVNENSNISSSITEFINNSQLKDFLWGCLFETADLKIYLPIINRAISMLCNFTNSNSSVLSNGQSLVDTEELVALHDNLNLVLEDVDYQLGRIKKLHELYMPKRYQELKGLSIFSKYAVGSSSGGEFFDIINNNRKVGVILSSSASHLISGMVLSNFSTLREEPNLNLSHLETFIKSLIKDVDTSFKYNNSYQETPINIQNITPKTRPILQLLVAEIDLRNLQIQGYNIGHSLLVSNKENALPECYQSLNNISFQKAFFKFRLTRGEKLVLISPGYRYNTQDKINEELIIDFTKKQLQNKIFAIADELFFQLKKSETNDFLKYDASTLIVEVNENVIIEA